MASPGGAASHPAVVTVTLTAAQATALYDLACWAMDSDRDQGDLWLTGPESIEHPGLHAAAGAIIDAGGSGHDYV